MRRVKFKAYPSFFILVAIFAVWGLYQWFEDPFQMNSSEEGYLYTQNNIVMFIQWADTNNQLTGQVQETYLDNTNTLHHDSHPFTGSHGKNNLSLMLSKNISNGWSGETWTGNLNGKELELVIPANGQLSTVPFTLGTLSDYNQKVSELQQQAQQASTQ
ncbi:hypothetical protein PP175_25770 (plasmid) [Aneurinibacillus sp. Ricciae_BoGa-3]|uniref:hypothetical protein n=1 Tax=Aneurinibacillus sp. Ricciae_BoGa-3 TaxID=3022697 RepID=UPI00234192A5|nr:hypothetical protein [Aneurinibacillus sp. Ricciae_BoGa-3]WCK57477.1 hypothetical protein PP175_25770 [Aneurinibacillus sp. Ricciae_BoGa-3]